MEVVYAGIERAADKNSDSSCLAFRLKEIVLEILASAREPLKRSEVIERVRRIVPRRGFTLSSQAAITKTMKALAILIGAKKVTTPRLGWYSLPEPLI